jgi:polyhydroxyalkanoate synthesis regulator phasin
LANAQGQVTRQAARVRQLETKLSELLGEQVWRKSGLGARADIDQLQRRITELEQQVVDLRG